MGKGINKIIFSIFGGILCSSFVLSSVNLLDFAAAENKANGSGGLAVWSEIDSEIQEKYSLDS